MVEHSRKYSAGTAGRGSHYCPSAGIFLAHRKGVGENQPSCPEHVLVALGPDEIAGGLPPQMQRARKGSLLINSPLDSLAHHPPDQFQMLPESRPTSLVRIHIFPELLSVGIAPFQNP